MESQIDPMWHSHLSLRKKKNVIELYFKNMRDKEGGKKEMGYNKSAKMQMETDNETGT